MRRRGRAISISARTSVRYGKKRQKRAPKWFCSILGNSLGGSFASEILDSENVATFFNKVGYDAIILGNQDIQLPMKSLSDVRVPMLNPFRLERSDYPPAVRSDSIVLKKGRLEVRLFAVFCPDQSSTWPLTAASIPLASRPPVCP